MVLYLEVLHDGFLVRHEYRDGTSILHALSLLLDGFCRPVGKGGPKGDIDEFGMIFRISTNVDIRIVKIYLTFSYRDIL